MGSERVSMERAGMSDPAAAGPHRVVASEREASEFQWSELESRDINYIIRGARVRKRAASESKLSELRCDRLLPAFSTSRFASCEATFPRARARKWGKKREKPVSHWEVRARHGRSPP